MTLKNDTWKSPEFLVGLNTKFVKYNGGSSTRKEQNVIVIGNIMYF